MRDTSDQAPLGGYTVVRSSDPEDVHRSASALMNRHSMQLAGDPGRFAAEIRVAPVGALAMIYFRYGAAVEINPAPFDGFAAVHLPLRGRLAVERADGDRHVAGAGGGAVFSETESVRMRWSDDLELLVLRIDRDALARKLHALTGQRATRPLVFAPHVGANAALGSTIRSLQASIDGFGPDGLPPVLAEEFEELVLSLLLLEHEHNYSDSIESTVPPSAAGTVRRATAFVSDNHAAPLRIDDLARAAHVSERVLYEAFRREFGQSPMLWVRRFRLERAREALIAADANQGATVAEIAAEHGFGHVGRFAVDYRARYGESPVQTLRLGDGADL